MCITHICFVQSYVCLSVKVECLHENWNDTLWCCASLCWFSKCCHCGKGAFLCVLVAWFWGCDKRPPCRSCCEWVVGKRLLGSVSACINLRFVCRYLIEIFILRPLVPKAFIDTFLKAPNVMFFFGSVGMKETPHYTCLWLLSSNFPNVCFAMKPCVCSHGCV